jgi:hypothetical protein
MSAAGGGGGGGGGASAPAGNINADFIEQFGKNIPLRPNVKQRFIGMRHNPRYSSETTVGPQFTESLIDPEHGLISRFLPAGMVDDVIERNNVREIIELLTHARALLHDIFNVFLDKNEELYEFQYLQEIIKNYKKQQEKYRRYLGYKEIQAARHGRYGRLLSIEPDFNFNNYGNPKPSKYITIPGSNTLNGMRVEPNYERDGKMGLLDNPVNPQYENPAFLAVLEGPQAIFQSMREEENPELFNLPQDFFMGFVSPKTIEYLTFLKNMYIHLQLQIKKLEDAKKTAMKRVITKKSAMKSFIYRNKDQIDKLIALRMKNLQEIADKHGFNSVNSLTVDAIAERLMSASAEERDELLALIQPNRLPKIQNNLNRLRTIRQTAGRRRLANKTKRRNKH